ncbi:MAG: hypothetical protein UV59_C0025G0011 [Candidatus Gottesmanbacteria bacterium GW2011_GWA1_43_11]|uniref:Uncharacterized protein n=1 Tax=Candidatus Gottesmanbacteria bacterium GW2011_GWA1_43_11 TaxID=1618436 RepID=A0A0G1CEP7_9BACT|nr:MAG: hypothetical protein UV59_C0025G0011 [Candidatus Gottesmanbacteria bacterium GW2011_GWA1_43_11]
MSWNHTMYSNGTNLQNLLEQQQPLLCNAWEIHTQMVRTIMQQINGSGIVISDSYELPNLEYIFSQVTRELMKSQEVSLELARSVVSIVMSGYVINENNTIRLRSPGNEKANGNGSYKERM